MKAAWWDGETETHYDYDVPMIRLDDPDGHEAWDILVMRLTPKYIVAMPRPCGLPRLPELRFRRIDGSPTNGPWPPIPRDAWETISRAPEHWSAADDARRQRRVAPGDGR